jgi:competence protein ComEC
VSLRAESHGLVPTERVRTIQLALGGALAWLACATCLAWQPVPLLLLGLGSLAIAAGVLLARAQFAYPLAVCAGCVALVVLPLAGRQYADRSSPLATLAAHRTVAELEVVTRGDPVQVAAQGVAGSARVAVAAAAHDIVRGSVRAHAGGHVLIIAPAAGWVDVLPGQRLRFSAQVAPSQSPGPSGVVAFARGAPSLLGRPPWWQRGAQRVRVSLRAASRELPAGPRGLLPGMVDGDVSGLDPVIQAHFRVAGMTHLVAVSGTNCSILAGAVLLALRRSRARPWLRAVIAGSVIVAFVVVARPSPSVLRAAVMAAVGLYALAAGHRRNGSNAIGAAIVVLLVWDPLLARDAGFALSALATEALLTLAIERRRVPAAIAAPVAVAASAHVVTAPVIATLSGQVSLVAIPANVVAEPVVAVTTVLGFVAALVAPVWLPAGVFVAALAGWPCRWLITVADRFGELPGATVPWPATPAGAVLLAVASAAAFILAVRYRTFRRGLAAALVVAVFIQIPVRSVVTAWPPSGWFFVACDVGQGDGLVLNAGAGTAVVVDAGPDAVTMDRCLRDLGVRHVPLLVFSHLHLDHVGGVDGVFRARTVDRVATGGLDQPVSGLHLVEHALTAHRLGLGLLVPGTAFTVGDTQLEVLGAATYHGTRSDPNNSSVVLRATVHGVRILLTGDVELEAQQDLVNRHIDATADVLKVPHHGSAYSLPAFLAAVHASVAVISVGAHNDYGHPAPSLLATLQRLRVPSSRTDRDGDVAFAGDRGELRTVRRGTSAVAGRAVSQAR